MPDTEDFEPEEEGLTETELADKLKENESEGMLSGADVPALFSAFLEAEVVTFKIGGCSQESSATLKQMNADRLAKYKDSVSRFSTMEGARSSDTKFMFEPSTADADVAILLGTVTAMDLVYNKPVIGGGTTVEKYPFPAVGKDREKFFREMHPDIRGRLVRECKRVNGLHPLSPK